MKVQIVELPDAKFRHRFCWWSNWIDVAIFDYACKPWLVQMSVSRTNAKRFKSVAITGRFYRQASCGAIGDLIQMEKAK